MSTQGWFCSTSEAMTARATSVATISIGPISKVIANPNRAITRKDGNPTRRKATREKKGSDKEGLINNDYTPPGNKKHFARARHSDFLFYYDPILNPGPRGAHGVIILRIQIP